MKHNINEKNVSKMFMTEDSIKMNLKKYFGHKTSFLDERLYYILAKGFKNRRVYMDDLIEQLYIPLFEAPPI